MNTPLLILPVLSALLCAGLGLFTLSRNPRHPANIGFTLGMLSLVVIETGGAIVLYSGGYALTVLGTRLMVIGQAVLPVTWLLFSVVFARSNRTQILKKWVPVLAVMTAISLLFIFLSGSPNFIIHSRSGVSAHGYIGKYFYIYLLLGLLINLIQLENTLRSSSGSRRINIKYVIFGIGAILAFTLYSTSQTLLFGGISTEVLPVESAVILISVLVMSLSIVKHRLMDMDIFISRYVVYNSLTLLLVGLYLIMVGIVIQGIRYFNFKLDYFVITVFVFISILVLTFLLFSATLRRRVQIFITRHFYRQKYEFREKWNEATEKISSRRSTDSVITALDKMISETMGPKSVYLWSYNPVFGEYHGHGNVPVEYKNLPKNSRTIEESKRFLVPFMVDIPGDESAPATKEASLYGATEAVLCAPLVTGDDIMGFALLGRDMTGQPYSEDDYGFLKVLTTQAAIQIKNILLAQDLLNVKELEAFHNMSSFVMHDLKNLTNSLSLVSQNARENINNPEFQKDAIRTIDGTVARMKSLIGKLSNLPTDIHIRKKSTDLKRLVEHAIELMPDTEQKNVTVRNDIDPAVRVSIDQDAILMVFLNLLKNAYEAVDAGGRIIIISELSNDNIEVSVSDNGTGMSQEYVQTALFRPFKSTKKSGFGIGLFQCKAIIDAHGGNISVQSTEGSGTTFKIALPEAASE